MNLNQPYKPIATYESYGSVQVGYRIEVSMPKELTEEDKVAMYAVTDLLQKVLYTSIYRDDPGQIEGHKQQEIEFRKLFGDELIYLEEIPNEYSHDPYYVHTPWYIVTTRIGHFKLGWRKRVINIDWTRTRCRVRPEELFPNEDVTKSNKYDKELYIHAYGYEKAAEYIQTILKAAT